MGEQLTQSDVKKIKEEIEYRKLVVRKRELEAVRRPGPGDLSENFEYKAAKQDKTATKQDTLPGADAQERQNHLG